VAEALDGLPPAVHGMLQNVAIVIQEWPTRRQMREQGVGDRYDLLGLYEGTPIAERDSTYGMVLPDKITIFKGPLEAMCPSRESLAQEVRKTVVHELAHHLGMDDEELASLHYD